MEVAIYCRLSEEDRNKQYETDDSQSIQNQKAMLTQYADDHGWNIYDIYSDDDYTGSDRRRPEFNRLLKDAENKKFDIILCKTQSRFTRELELVEKYIHGLFPIWGIRFVSVVDNADTEVKGNKKSRQINGLINEWYLEDMSDNIKSVLTNRRVNGFHIGAFSLYGYMKDPEHRGHLIIDPEAAEVVREVFNLYAQGYGKSSIARILNDRGIPNPTEYKRLKGLRYKQPKTKNSTLWKYFAISDMLVNEMYIGNMVQGKYGSVSYKTKKNKPRPKEQWYIVKNTHEPIIERELWDRVQTMLAAKFKPFSDGKIGIFARKVRCANCGYVMTTSKVRQYRYLKCPTKPVAKDACIGSFIAVRSLEAFVLKEINAMAEKYINADEVADDIDWNDDLKSEQAKLLDEINTYDSKIKDYANQVKELYMDKVRGIISENDYVEFSREFSSERDRFEKQRLEAKKQLECINEKINNPQRRAEALSQYLHMEHLNRDAVDVLIDHIEVGKRDSETKEIPIKIYWNF